MGAAPRDNWRAVIRRAHIQEGNSMNKGRALLAAAAAITIGLPLAPADAATGAPARPGGVALTWAPTYMSTQHSFSQTEAVALAKQFDLIAGMPISFKGDVPAMKNVTPDLTVLTYANATFLDGSTAGIPEAEFAHNSSGGRIRSTNFGNYLMEPSNAGWRSRSVDKCHDRSASAGYDGCLLDMLTMGIFAKGYVTSLPRKPGGGAYTQTEWRAQLIRLADQFQAGNTRVHVGNAVSNAFRYWDADVTSRELVLSMPAAQMEDFLRGSGDSASRFPSASDWRGAVDVIRDMEAHGVAGLFTTKLWSSASAAQVAQWQKFSMASFLMGANGNSYFAFTRSRDKAGATGANAPYRMPKNLGSPTTGMTASGAAFVRSFGNGKAVVNPSASTVTVNLGGSYRSLSGRTVSSVTLAPHSGEVLVRA